MTENINAHYGIWSDYSARWTTLFDDLGDTDYAKEFAIVYADSLSPMPHHTYRVALRTYNKRTCGWDYNEIYRTLPAKQ